ncbi:MAG: hypothetical protein ABSE73_07820 [Planctomycetota bacterium]
MHEYRGGLALVLSLTGAVFSVSAAAVADKVDSGAADASNGVVVSPDSAERPGAGEAAKPNPARAAAEPDWSAEHPERLTEQDCVGKPDQVVRPSKKDQAMGKKDRAMAQGRNDRLERPETIDRQGAACAA